MAKKIEKKSSINSKTLTKKISKGKKGQIWAKKVLMIRPSCFYLNEETFGDNKFMERTKLTKKKTTLLA